MSTIVKSIMLIRGIPLDETSAGDASALTELGEARFHSSLPEHPIVGDVRGRGLILGLELVADKVTKQSFERVLETSLRVQNAAFEPGLVTYSYTGAANGVVGDMILMAPR